MEDLYTIKPSQVSVRFDTTDYIPVPDEWQTNSTDAAVRDNATSGQLKIIKIRNRGVGLGTANLTYVGVPIKGDGIVSFTVVINNDSEVETVTVSHGGNGSLTELLTLLKLEFPLVQPQLHLMSSSLPMVDMEFDIYRELGFFRFCSYGDLRTILKTQISSQETSLQELEFVKIQSNKELQLSSPKISASGLY